MLSEFGIMGAAVVGFLVTLQLMDFFPDGNKAIFIGIGVAMVVSFGAYTKSLGRPLMFVLILIMMPLATTEIGTDGWISGIMANAVTFDGGWILVYTSFIMMVLRFFAGPIVHQLSALGLLMVSCVLAIAGLWSLSFAEGVAIIFAAATLYALGKTFFWPTMLGIVSEQTPRGGALTLNAISGIGMLAVGTLGFPYIGALQADREIQAVQPYIGSVPEADVLTEKTIYEIIEYKTLDMDKVNELVVDKTPADEQGALKSDIEAASAGSGQKALASMTVFPLIMLICYIAIWFYFKSRGGYKPVTLSDES
jgi:MFS family permease